MNDAFDRQTMVYLYITKQDPKQFLQINNFSKRQHEEVTEPRVSHKFPMIKLKPESSKINTASP